jgi:hypothetical protein
MSFFLLLFVTKLLSMKSTKLFALCISLFVSSANIASALTFDSSIESGLIKRYTIATEHFQIDFSDLIMSQTDTDGDGISNIIETVAEAAEASWDYVINDLDYEAPISSGKLSLILDDNDEYLISGAVGVTSIGSDSNPYMAIDPWTSSNVLKVTVAHEFFHAVQFGYGTGFATSYQGISWAEATAVWIEDLVYDSVDDYVLYLPDFFDYPDYSVFSSGAPADTYFVYALNIWPRFLAEFLDDEGVIRDIWTNYFASDLDDDNHYKVFDAAKEAIVTQGENIDEVFQNFTIWNLSPEDFYEEGATYPEPYILDNPTQGEYTLSDVDYVPALFATNYLYFENEDSETSFYFHIVKPDNVSFAVTIVPENNGNIDFGKLKSVIIPKSSSMDEELSIEAIGSYEGVYAIISPLEKEFDYSDGSEDVFDEGYQYYYMGSYGVSMMDGDELTPDEKSVNEGEEVIPTDDGREDDVLNLKVLTYDEDSVTFNWNRITDSDIASYKIYYGNESGEYTSSKQISKAYSTNTTIDNLEEGETYYFQIKAFDDRSQEIDAYRSEEIVLVPAEWLFEDVSFSDEHYESIAELVDRGIFEGYSDNTFRAENEINRAELLKILIEGIGITPSSSEYRNCFNDVKTEWFAPYVCYAKKQNWVQGYADQNFRPSNTVNKVEALKMLFKVYGEDLVEGTKVNSLPYNDLDRSAWYAIYVWKAVQLGILEESATSTFSPEALRTRGDMAEELYRYLIINDL